MASLLDLAGYVQKQGELGRQRGEQSRISSLASQAYTAPRTDRQSILGQMAQTSPGAAVEQEKRFRQGDSDRMADLSRKAKIFVGMAESGNAQAVASLYPQIAQEARDLGLGDIPMEYNDTFLPGLKKFATILDGDQTSEVGVQSTYVDAQGNRVAILRDGSTRTLGQNAPNNQIIDTGNGFFGVNKGNLSASPVMVGGQPQQAPQPGVGPGTYQTPQGLIRVGDLTPEQQELMLADIQSGQGSDQYQLPRRDVSPQQFGGGQQLRSAPKAQAPSELDRRIETARAMGASEDEIRRMVIGRDGAAAGAKPLPPAALKELLAVEDAMAAAQNVSSMIKKHSERMANGDLVVGPVDSIAAQFRTRLGMSNANDVNLNEYRADLTKIVNESLRLNSGVQTEGDAQRAANELMDANDPATAARALRRLQEYNTRAIDLQKRKAELVRRNYGQDTSGQPAQQRTDSGASGSVLRYNPATGDFE